MFSTFANSYVHNLTKKGKSVYWPGIKRTVDISVNSENTQGLTDSDVQAIAASSITEWNGLSSFSLRKKVTSTKGLIGINEFYFSNDLTFFNGSGVIGLTQVGFDDESGVISEADILINDGFTFSTNPLDANYLGNVITHEAGHFLGLGHGQVMGSTMFYALSRGQHKIADDDKAGVYTIYPTGDQNKGALLGTVIGGKKLIPVFGAHVEAISIKTGKVMGASISELDGRFKIGGLPLEDQYLIFTRPLTPIGLPINYASVHNDFCEANTNYRGSFFQSCGVRSIGFPQAVRLKNSSVDVGNVTIRCALDTPPEYMQTKNQEATDFDLNTGTQSGIGGSFVGFFSNLELKQSVVQDYFKMNLSNVNWDDLSTQASLYLELKITNQTFYSPFKANVVVRRGLGSYEATPVQYTQEADGYLTIDTIKRIPINRSLSSDNEFEVKITPEVMDGDHFPAGIPYNKSDIFPSYTDFQESLYFYLVTATIVKDNGDGTYTQLASKNDDLTDNSLCPDAMGTYALTRYTSTGESSTPERKKAVGCGTVEMGSRGGGSGPGSFMIGLLFCFILSYAASRYSKMA
jgi:hypothetical protein